MKKFSMTLFSWLLVPLLFVGHFFTQHFAFLFLYGVATTVAIVAFSITVVFTLKFFDDKKFRAGAVEKLKKITPIQKFVSICYYVFPSIYLLYFEFYFLAFLTIICGFCAMYLHTLARQLLDEVEQEKLNEIASRVNMAKGMSSVTDV